jgi:hypothetical protein
MTRGGSRYGSVGHKAEIGAFDIILEMSCTGWAGVWDFDSLGN